MTASSRESAAEPPPEQPIPGSIHASTHHPSTHRASGLGPARQAARQARGPSPDRDGDELAGVVAVVTGGGRGIGRGIVDRFLAAGATVAIAQRGDLDEGLRADPRVLVVRADLADPAGYAGIATTVEDRLGGADVLVNNAGVMFERGIAELTVDEWDRMVAINLRAPALLTAALLPQLRRSGRGAVVNIGSIEGLAANPGHAAYCATKAGVHGLTRALAVDLGADGVRCNAIAPGWIDTDLSEAYLDSMPDPQGARRRIVDLHPIGGTGRPEDVGDAAVFLAGERSRFLTGEVVVVDGGRTARLPTPV